MTRRYDNAAGVSERCARETLMKAFRSGWRPSLDGCLPKPPKGFCKAPSVVSQGSVPGSSASGCPAQDISCSGGHQMEIVSVGSKRTRQVSQGFVPGSSASDGCLKGPCVPVLHQKRKRLHRTLSGSGVSVCKMWSCGTEADPTKDAVFGVLSEHAKRCTSCWR